MSKKDTIYIDVEDDITAIIDKATSASAPIVALVLPKRSSVLQSVVNMKLLKKATDEEKKKLVLITSEANLLPLAGAIGVHVAPTLQSKPEIPEYEEAVDLDDSTIEDDTPPVEDEEDEDGDDDEIDDDELEEASTKTSDSNEKIKELKGDGKIKIPNFQRFRMKFIIAGIVLLVLIILWVVGFIILPKADIKIIAQTTRVPTELNFAVSTEATTNDLEEKVLVGTEEELVKTMSQSFTPTGEKDIGQRANGTMTVKNCLSSETVEIPAGTIFTSDSFGYEYASTEAVSVPGGSFFFFNCSSPGTADVPVQAIEGGSEKNIAADNYESDFSSAVVGEGGQMSGGTTEIVNVVTQEDIDQASKQLLNKTDEEAKAELLSEFSDDQFVLEDTFDVSKSDPTSSPKVGEEANSATVSAQFTYTAIAVEREALSEILVKKQEESIDTSQQVILDDGLDNAQVNTGEELSARVLAANLTTEGFAGPDFNTEALAEEVSGLGYSAVIETLKQKPGVQEVEVDFSPFWVFNAPKASKITIEVEVAEHNLQ